MKGIINWSHVGSTPTSCTNMNILLGHNDQVDVQVPKYNLYVNEIIRNR